MERLRNIWVLMLAACLLAVHFLQAAPHHSQFDAAFGPALSVPRQVPNSATNRTPRNRIDQTLTEARAKSRGCLECHGGIEEMHQSPNVVLGCTDCHGGNSTPGLTQHKAHVAPRHEIFWKSSANPNDSSVLL